MKNNIFQEQLDKDYIHDELMLSARELISKYHPLTPSLQIEELLKSIKNENQVTAIAFVNKISSALKIENEFQYTALKAICEVTKKLATPEYVDIAAQFGEFQAKAIAFVNKISSALKIENEFQYTALKAICEVTKKLATPEYVDVAAQFGEFQAKALDYIEDMNSALIITNEAQLEALKDAFEKKGGRLQEQEIIKDVMQFNPYQEKAVTLVESFMDASLIDNAIKISAASLLLELLDKPNLPSDVVKVLAKFTNEFQVEALRFVSRNVAAIEKIALLIDSELKLRVIKEIFQESGLLSSYKNEVTKFENEYQYKAKQMANLGYALDINTDIRYAVAETLHKKSNNLLNIDDMIMVRSFTTYSQVDAILLTNSLRDARKIVTKQDLEKIEKYLSITGKEKIESDNISYVLGLTNQYQFEALKFSSAKNALKIFTNIRLEALKVAHELGKTLDIDMIAKFMYDIQIKALKYAKDYKTALMVKNDYVLSQLEKLYIQKENVAIEHKEMMDFLFPGVFSLSAAKPTEYKESALVVLDNKVEQTDGYDTISHEVFISAITEQKLADKDYYVSFISSRNDNYLYKDNLLQFMKEVEEVQVCVQIASEYKPTHNKENIAVYNQDGTVIVYYHNGNTEIYNQDGSMIAYNPDGSINDNVSIDAYNEDGTLSNNRVKLLSDTDGGVNIYANGNMVAYNRDGTMNAVRSVILQDSTLSKVINEGKAFTSLCTSSLSKAADLIKKSHGSALKAKDIAIFAKNTEEGKSFITNLYEDACLAFNVDCKNTDRSKDHYAEQKYLANEVQAVLQLTSNGYSALAGVNNNDMLADNE
jgi:hypothetical protein